MVEYFENPLLPGRKMFRCEKHAASLQVQSCAGMWRDANEHGKVPERLFRCVQCPLGAEHAGAGDVAMNPVRGTTTCARCHRTDLRLIGRNLCVGCKNREYEWVKGRNAKGKMPTQHPALHARAVVVMADGKVRKVARAMTASTLELVIEVLRDEPKRAMFGLGCGGIYAAA